MFVLLEKLDEPFFKLDAPIIEGDGSLKTLTKSQNNKIIGETRIWLPLSKKKISASYLKPSSTKKA